ncbi:hypothetical protein OBE_16599 [human gut metagenome]|uniref:Uncharacterized protein n=1 Tax=human gut metagenome TaxID=408170 RepID=K1RQS8_9ZZZZ
MCFVIATEYIGTFRWGKDGEIDNIFAQDSSHIGTIKKDYWGRENQNAYLEYDTSNTDYAFNKANSYLFKKWSKWICRWRRRVFFDIIVC